MSGAGAGLQSAVARTRRAQRIGSTIGRVYLGAKAHQLLDRGAPFGVSRRTLERIRRRRWRRFHRASAKSVHAAAIELQGLILKGSQYLGARADLMPPEWVSVLADLQDRVPPRSFASVRASVESELRCPIGEVFRNFSMRPLAAASLAQVHAAELHDGTRVAVKVQYPEVAELVHDDLANLRTLFRAIDWLEPDFDLVPVVDELAQMLPEELDFLIEARNTERARAIFADTPEVLVPRVHWALSSRRVLVTDFIDGIKITDRDALAAAGVDPAWAAAALVRAWSQQVLAHGFFHADPHPGNLAVLPSGPRLVLLDFGLAKELPEDFRARCQALLGAFLKRDASAVAEALEALGFETRDGSRDSLENLARAGLELARALAERGSLGPDRLTALGDELAEQIRQHPLVRVPSHVVLLARALGLLSGVARSLDAPIDPLRIALPWVLGNGVAD